MIPDEAVNAAQKAYIALRAAEGYKYPHEYAEAMLAAAAPYLKSEAWDEGRKHGARYPYGERGLATDDNPYRS